MTGAQSTAQITKLYAFGSNGAGQLGVGHQDDLSEPQVCRFGSSTEVLSQTPSVPDKQFIDHVPNTATIDKLVAGGNHTLVLTDRRDVYATGNNCDGRCIAGAEVDTLNVFSLVPWAKDRNITDVAATWEASFLVEDRRKVWSCGSGGKGELGLGQGVVKSATPRLVLDVHEDHGSSCSVVSIAGSMSHVVVILSNGQVYGWGSCRKGQLGQEVQSRKSVWQPYRIDLGFAALNNVVGRDFSLFTSLQHGFTVLGEFAKVPGTLELGLESQSTQYLAGWSTIYRLSQGQVSSYGQGRRGQLSPTNLPPVTVMAAGSEHCLALLHDSRLIAWGWGEHGNCGAPLDNHGNVVNRFNTVSTSSLNHVTLVGVGAGCASSFTWGTMSPLSSRA